MTDDEVDQEVLETLADIRELPATVYVVGAPGPQNVAVGITLPDGTTVAGTAVIRLGS